MLRIGSRSGHGRRHQRTLGGIAAALIAACSLAATLVVAGAGSATAAGPTTAEVTALDKCPANSWVCGDSERFTTLPANYAVSMRCWVDARATPGRGPRWFYVTAGEWTGFIKAEAVRQSTQVKTPNCTTQRDVEASLWATALAQQSGDGALHPSPDLKNRALRNWGFSDWGPKNDWSGDCVMFAGLAWDHVGNKNAIKTGYATASRQARSGPLQAPSARPPRGALVFWDGGSFGHVAISLGNGYVATTQGFDTDRASTPNTVKRIDAQNRSYRYIGWRMP